MREDSLMRKLCLAISNPAIWFAALVLIVLWNLLKLSDLALGLTFLLMEILAVIWRNVRIFGRRLNSSSVVEAYKAVVACGA